MLIGLVVSSKVNCGPGLGVIREPGAERKTVLPGGEVTDFHCTPPDISEVLIREGMQPFFEHRGLREDRQRIK